MAKWNLDKSCDPKINHSSEQQPSIYGELELEADADGIWLLDVGSKHGTLQLGHVSWQTIAIYIKEYL
jgi:hypothetical protein